MKQALSILGLIVLGILLVVLLGGAQENAEALEYENETYRYSFEYPDKYDINEYTPEEVAIGTPTTEGGFESVAEVSVVGSGAEGGYESFEEFLFESSSMRCAADGPNETIFCDEVEQQQPFETQEGLTGTTYYLRRVHRNLTTGEEEVGGFGPLFAFNIAANVPASDFAALLVHPPFNTSAEEADSSLVRAIAESVEIDRVEAEEMEIEEEVEIDEEGEVETEETEMPGGLY